MDKQILRFELSQNDIQIKKLAEKEFLGLDIYAISNIYPNRNDTAFTQQSLEKARPTCYNKPILGAFNVFRDDFLEHNGDEKYDRELDLSYWDTNGRQDERPLGVIRESDTVEIVEKDGLYWLKISCVIWTQYAYKQVKRILKSGSKKVSVEVIVKQSHTDDQGILVIDDFILTGITILGDNISEGIPGAHLSVPELIRDDKFATKFQTLCFAYTKAKLNNGDIKLDDCSDIIYYNTLSEMEGQKRMTYAEKMALLTSRLAEVYGNDQSCPDFWLCDFSDEYVIIHDYKEDKYFKIPYILKTQEDAVEITFDLENKIEQVPSFKDVAREFVTINEEPKHIDELFTLYQDTNQTLAQIQSEYADFKAAHDSLTLYVDIDGEQYDVTQLKAKYDAVITEWTNRYNATNEALEQSQQLYKQLQEQVALETANKLCGDGLALVDDEDELDEDVKASIKEKCIQHVYQSIQEVENDIAQALYQKKKNNRQKTFKQTIDHNSPVAEVNIFDRLK